MHILGLSNGSVKGNSEILLKSALLAAQESSPSTTVSWIHVPSVSYPPNPKPLDGAPDISGHKLMTRIGVNGTDAITDDRRAVLDAILDADALILATPVYSHSPAGAMKALFDRILGPFTDVTFIARVKESQDCGSDKYRNVQVDERILKPRIAAFMAVAGSTVPDQVTLALPMMHTFIYCLHPKVVDQEVFMGSARPGSVVKDGGRDVKRAREIGRNVASQLGKSFEDAKYLGPEKEGDCPYCHLSKIEIDYTKDNAVGCVTCGARGKLVVGDEGVIRPVWEPNSGVSCITMLGKENHLDDIQTVAAREAPKVEAVKDEIAAFWMSDVPVVSLPSHKQGSVKSAL